MVVPGSRSRSSSPKKPGTPRVATRRVSRFSPRPFSSPLAAVRNVGRPPIVLEWTSTVIRVGYAEQYQPQHIIPLPPRDNSNSSSPKYWDCEEESRWYLYISPIIRQVFDRLMLDPTTRRVVVITEPYPPLVWEAAIKEALWNIGVPAVAFLNFLEVVPLAQGWNRGMVIHVGTNESHFLAHVDGHPLPFTYQAVPCGYKTGVDDPTKIRTKFDDKMEKAWLMEDNPNSLIVALLKCLEECPMDARKDVVGNLLVCGDTAVLVPDLARRLALQVKQVLGGSGSSEGGGEQAAEEEATTTTTTTTTTNNLTYVPVGRKILKPLADHVGLLSCAPYRPDLISWVGGSIYSTIWHRHDDQDANVQWVFSPASASE